eukprot:96878_1
MNIPKFRTFSILIFIGILLYITVAFIISICVPIRINFSTTTHSQIDSLETTSSTPVPTSMHTNKKECGRFWLYNHHGLRLSVHTITNDTVYIKNISPGRQHCNASRITLYVTIQGHELLGGLAIPDPIKCQWHYTFRITVSGHYKVMTRLLYYDGDIEFNYSKCNVIRNSIVYNNITTVIDSDGVYHDDTYIMQRIYDEKFYKEQEQCCEWCARVDRCAMYISYQANARDDPLSVLSNRCIMFNRSAITHLSILNRNHIPRPFPNLNDAMLKRWVLGYNRNETTRYYLGSLSPTTPTQKHCRSRKYDIIHNGNQNVFVLQKYAIQPGHKPRCSFDSSKHFAGRWKHVGNDTELVDLITWTVRRCTTTDFEQGIRNIYFWGDSIINTMVELMQNEIKLDKTLFGCNSVIKGNERTYPLLCVSHGMPAGTMTRQQNVLKNGTKDVFVFNLNLVHKLWHKTVTETETYLNSMIEELTRYFIGEYGNDTSTWPTRVVVELPLIISEREYHCTAPRTIKINALVHKIFEEKWGWNVFPLYTLTEAMQYDFSLGQDGLHPSTFVLVDIIRILFEFILNSF